MGRLADLGDGTVVLVIILTEIFGGRTQCAYSSVRNGKLTVFIALNFNQNENFPVAGSDQNKYS